MASAGRLPVAEYALQAIEAIDHEWFAGPIAGQGVGADVAERGANAGHGGRHDGFAGGDFVTESADRPRAASMPLKGTHLIIDAGTVSP